MKEENDIGPDLDMNQELELVAEMIQRTKQTVLDRGPFFLLWGILVFLACATTFTFSQLGMESLNWLP